MKVKRFWLFLALILIGYSGGIITGVIVDADQVYHTTIKKIRQGRSPGGRIILDVDTDNSVKSRKELRQERREKRREERRNKQDSEG